MFIDHNTTSHAEPTDQHNLEQTDQSHLVAQLGNEEQDNNLHQIPHNEPVALEETNPKQIGS